MFLAQHYKGRYDEAQDLSVASQTQAILDICWKFRLRSNLGLFRRLTVNLLLACLLPARTRQFANEALEILPILTDELREENVGQDEIDRELLDVQQFTKALLENAKRGNLGEAVEESIDFDPTPGVLGKQLESEARSSSSVNALRAEGYLGKVQVEGIEYNPFSNEIGGRDGNKYSIFAKIISPITRNNLMLPLPTIFLQATRV